MTQIELIKQEIERLENRCVTAETFAEELLSFIESLEQERKEKSMDLEDGEEIPINEMSDTHLDNAIKHDREREQKLEELSFCEYYPE